MLEITKISAQGIRNTSRLPMICFFSSHRVKPFITITTFSSSLPSSSCNSIKGVNESHVYTTRVDEEGGPNPTWEDKFHVPLDPKFGPTVLYLHLQVFTLRAVLSPALLGWVQIPASDIFTGFAVIGSTHHLSYRIREKDGSRGHGVINVTLRFVGEVPTAGCMNEVDKCRTSIGIPVSMWPMCRQQYK